MNDKYEVLTKELLEKNSFLSYSQARAWIELLWEDFQVTYAKSGRYQNEEMTEQIVRTWINNHGERLHEIRTNNPKYSHLINQDDHVKH
ncbi:YfhJ family protein [Bacillus sp. C1]